MPWLIAAVTGILSIALIAQGSLGLLRSPPSPEQMKSQSFDHRAVLLLVAIAAFAVAIPYAGFVYAGIPFFACAMLLYGARQPLVIIGASITVPVLLQFVFRNVFSIILPAGVF